MGNVIFRIQLNPLNRGNFLLLFVKKLSILGAGGFFWIIFPLTTETVYEKGLRYSLMLFHTRSIVVKCDSDLHFIYERRINTHANLNLIGVIFEERRGILMPFKLQERLRFPRHASMTLQIWLSRRSTAVTGKCLNSVVCRRRSFLDGLPLQRILMSQSSTLILHHHYRYYRRHHHFASSFNCQQAIVQIETDCASLKQRRQMQPTKLSVNKNGCNAST